MRKTFAILLISILFLQTLKNSYVLIDYSINTETFIKENCENKNNVALHCDGKCHLKKQLEIEVPTEKSEKKSTIKKNTSENLFCESIIHFKYTSEECYFSKLNHSTLYSSFFTSTILDSLFQPPRV